MPGAGGNELPKTAIFFLRATVNLDVISRGETRQSPHYMFCTPVGSHTERVDRITFLAVDGDGLVSLIHPLVVVLGGKYQDETGDIWEMKGEIQVGNLLAMFKLTPLHFALNVSLLGAARMDFETHATALSSINL